MPNGVARQALTVEDMPRVTMNGPMRLGAPRSITVWNAACRLAVLGPPEPAIRPVRSFETSPGSSPESAIACSIAR